MVFQKFFTDLLMVGIGSWSGPNGFNTTFPIFVKALS